MIKSKKHIAIIGGGPAALIAAAFIDMNMYDVTIFEKNKTVGRKFLVAGKGGFNLTHSESIASMISRYYPRGFLDAALNDFSNENLIEWLAKIGIPTYVGSSGRVFPEKGIRPIEVLNKITIYIKEKGVNISTNHSWIGINDNGELMFNNDVTVKSDMCIFALGGSSWKVTGSDGKYLEWFENRSVKTIPFSASNCRFVVDWNPKILPKIEGQPLKNIAVRCGGTVVKGEALITKNGIEGNTIYTLSRLIQNQLKKNGKATIFIDLKPTLTSTIIHSKLSSSGHKNTSEKLKNTINLSKVQLCIVKEYVTKADYNNDEILSQKLKEIELTIVAPTDIDNAISTTGGIALEAINTDFELINMHNCFCIGEMLDWDAPTGGYLLQACISMGVFVARKLNKK
ncbi:MAG: TIGR03862 family flavoprotein [Saprospiraceae bacterium]